jgi:hypothetical protein
MMGDRKKREIPGVVLTRDDLQRLFDIASGLAQDAGFKLGMLQGISPIESAVVIALMHTNLEQALGNAVDGPEGVAYARKLLDGLIPVARQIMDFVGEHQDCGDTCVAHTSKKSEHAQAVETNIADALREAAGYRSTGGQS